jgi:hypothetical protein
LYQGMTSVVPQQVAKTSRASAPEVNGRSASLQAPENPHKKPSREPTQCVDRPDNDGENEATVREKSERPGELGVEYIGLGMSWMGRVVQEKDADTCSRRRAVSVVSFRMNETDCGSDAWIAECLPS